MHLDALKCLVSKIAGSSSRILVAGGLPAGSHLRYAYSEVKRARNIFHPSPEDRVARTSKISPYWKKTIGISIKTDKPWIVEPILQILGHPKTEEALVRLIKKSNGRFPVDTFCDALVTCYMYIFSKGYDGHRRPTISWDKNEFRRMAENARELHNRIEKILNVMDPLRTKGKPLCKGGIELFVKGHYRDADLGGDQIDDERIYIRTRYCHSILGQIGKTKTKAQTT